MTTWECDTVRFILDLSFSQNTKCQSSSCAVGDVVGPLFHTLDQQFAALSDCH